MTQTRPGQIARAAGLSVGFTLAILLGHVAPGMRTMLRHPSRDGVDYLVYTLHLHNENEDFHRRRVTTWLIEQGHALGLPLSVSFAIVNFTLLALAGVMLYLLVRRVPAGHANGLLAVTLFYTCYSTVFLFHTPVFGWDEPSQYLFIFAGLWALIPAVRRGRVADWVLYEVLFTISLLMRDASMLLLPGLAFMIWPRDRRIWQFTGPAVRQVVLLGLPAVFFFAYSAALRTWGKQDFAFETAPRFSHFVTNWLTSPHGALVSAMSLVVVLLPGFALLWVCRRDIHPRLIQGIVVSTLINTAIVVSVTYAREARLFALTLTLLWPVVAVYGLPELRRTISPATRQTLLGDRLLVTGLVVVTLLLAVLCFALFRPPALIQAVYAFLTLVCVAVLAVLRLAMRRETRTAQG